MSWSCRGWTAPNSSPLSDDGRQVLLTAWPDQSLATYLRPTDGSSPLKLGPGGGLALSPDGRWALAAQNEGGLGASANLSLLPIGVGVPKSISSAGLNIASARWFRDGKRIAVMAQRKDDTEWRLYVLPLDGTKPTLISDGPFVGVYWFELSRDGGLVAANAPDGTLELISMDRSSPPISIPEAGKWAIAAGWTSDGQLWVADNLMTFREAPTHIRRLDLEGRRTVEERLLSPSDPTGLTHIGRICITPDSQSVATNTGVPSATSTCWMV